VVQGGRSQQELQGCLCRVDDKNLWDRGTLIREYPGRSVRQGRDEFWPNQRDFSDLAFLDINLHASNGWRKSQARLMPDFHAGFFA
jgi:hypothetical protein